MFINNPGHTIKMTTMPIQKQFKILLLRNHWADFNETWHEASGTGALQCVYKLCHLDDLDLFYGKVNIGCPCI